MMAGYPNWWSMHPPSLIPPQYLLGSSSIPMNFFTDTPETPPNPSWSQMLFAGLPGEEERMGSVSHFQSKKLMENWEEESQIVKNPCSRGASVNIVDHVIKQEQLLPLPLISQAHASFWSNNNITTNNVLDFTHYNNPVHYSKIQLPHNPSECNNSAASAGVCNKKARVQSTQPLLKVRKEKLGDRITALHQLVSPFGKTDTASVLLEAIGYIRFLQGQIEALSSPYLANASKNIRNPHSVCGERNSVFPEDPGQDGEEPRDLRSRGLCLVPVACTQHVRSEINGADYWAPAYGSGF